MIMIQDLEMNKLDNLASDSLDFLHSVDAVVGSDRDPVGHLLLHLAVLVLVALLLHLQSDVLEMVGNENDKNISKKQFELNPQLGNGKLLQKF